MSGIQFKNSIYTVFKADTGNTIFDSISGKSIPVSNNAELNAALSEIIRYEDSIKLSFLKNSEKNGCVRLEISIKDNSYFLEVSIDPAVPELGCSATLRFVADTEEDGKQKIEKLIENLKEHRSRFFLADGPNSWSWEGGDYGRDVPSLCRIYGTITPEVYGLVYVCNICVIVLPNDFERSKFYTLYAAEGLCIAGDTIISQQPVSTEFTPLS